ncbi:MAG: hypothetical protein KDA20_08945 [Phycisphaerales bacterium]|nr:hypothetical protein [Phycisphaerales bacterium]
MSGSVRSAIVALVAMGACAVTGAEPEKLGIYWPGPDDGVFRGIVIEADLSESMHSSFEVLHVLPNENWKQGGVVFHGRVTEDDSSAFHLDYSISYEQMAELLRERVVVQGVQDANFNYVLFDKHTNRLGTVARSEDDHVLEVVFESLVGDTPIRLHYHGITAGVGTRIGKSAGKPVTDSWSTDLVVAATLLFTGTDAREGGLTLADCVKAAEQACKKNCTPGPERSCIASVSFTVEGGCSFTCQTYAQCCD